jgi:hypothetical protein
MSSISDKKEMERSSPKLAGAIALSSFGPKSLEILKSITCNIKIKKQSLPLGMLQCVMERPQLENEKNYILYILKP